VYVKKILEYNFIIGFYHRNITLMLLFFYLQSRIYNLRQNQWPIPSILLLEFRFNTTNRIFLHQTMRSEVFIFILMCAIIMCYEIFYRTNDNQMHTGTSVKLFCEILN